MKDDWRILMLRQVTMAMTVEVERDDFTGKLRLLVALDLVKHS